MGNLVIRQYNDKQLRWEVLLNYKWLSRTAQKHRRRVYPSTSLRRNLQSTHRFQLQITRRILFQNKKSLIFTPFFFFAFTITFGITKLDQRTRQTIAAKRFRSNLEESVNVEHTSITRISPKSFRRRLSQHMLVKWSRWSLSFHNLQQSNQLYIRYWILTRDAWG